MDKSLAPLTLRVKYSRFEKYQEFRVQELPDQVPIGNVPRTVIVEARGENTRQVRPPFFAFNLLQISNRAVQNQSSAGDIVTVSGILLPEKRRSGRSNASGLISSTVMYCFEVIRQKKSYADIEVFHFYFSFPAALYKKITRHLRR